MIQYRLRQELEKVAARYRWLRIWTALAGAWLLAALMSLLLWRAGVVVSGDVRLTAGLFGGTAAILAIVVISLVRKFGPGHAWVAHRVESTFPELRSCLLAAIEQRPDLPDGRFGFLQDSVIKQALVHAHCHAWQQVVPARRMTAAVAVQFTTFVLFLAMLSVVLFAAVPTISQGSTGPNTIVTAKEFSVAVEPGNTEVEKGTSLLVLARVTGPMPADAALVVAPAEGEKSSLAMSRSLEDPVFGSRVSSVREPFDYHVELPGWKSPVFHVTVFEYPKLERADARLAYPSYTGMEEKLVQDVRTISVVEGTQVTLLCHLNKPVAIATLNEKNAEPIALSPVPGEQSVYQAIIPADKSRRLKLELTDEAGRKNVQQWELSLTVVPNQPPVLKPVFPARDLEVSALEELDLKATAWDDFGVKRMGLSFDIAGQEQVEIVLGENAAARVRHNLAHVVRLEDLKAEPDQLLSYYFWAEDVGPDGNIRRTESDMYFAEVRHFEEIFRQGQPPPGGESQQSQQQQSQNEQNAQQLAQLQKEIINATWKLIRRELGDKLTKDFSKDTEEVGKSQAEALEQAGALAERVRDAQSQEHIATVVEAMHRAIDQLKSAHDKPASAPLKPALAAEQAAYQALLKLRAREHEVVRQQRRQQASSRSSARSQQQRQQMQQLDLTEEENRYEQQRLAQSQQETPEQREDRQMLNRLKELARRQHDLNERLKDLQSALQEAKTEEQKEEIRRQLQRLQEEQRQVLHDTDELRERMESPENAERNSEQRQQLDETREQVRRASESLEQEMVTQAAASGTRAEQQFEDLRNEFRRRDSNRFNEDLRQMREAARELDKRQQEITERQQQQPGTSKSKSEAKSLRDDGQREQTIQQLAEQRQRLSTLLDRMKQTVQDAEETEPLLSEKLYDSARTAQDQNIDRALDAAGRSLRQGLSDDARRLEEMAGRGITQLREGVERAAETVLGDETEALRRAREELRELSRQLNEEIAQNAPPGRRGEAQQQEAQQQEGQTQQGQSKQQGQQGQTKPGDSQPGQQGQSKQGESKQEERGEGGQPKQGQPGQRGEGKQAGQQPGEGQPQGQQPGQQQPGQQQGQQPGQRGEGQPQQGQGQQQPGQGQQQPGQQQPGQQRGGPRSLTEQGGREGGGALTREGARERTAAPLSGNDFLNWSDRLRDVEEMVDDPELRAEAARIRDRARSIRAEAKRHSATPNWDLVQQQVAGPLVELADRVAEELIRRSSKQAIVPLDRDPVPPKYSEKTRRYYEQLGSGK